MVYQILRQVHFKLSKPWVDCNFLHPHEEDGNEIAFGLRAWLRSMSLHYTWPHKIRFQISMVRPLDELQGPSQISWSWLALSVNWPLVLEPTDSVHSKSTHHSFPSWRLLQMFLRLPSLSWTCGARNTSLLKVQWDENQNHSLYLQLHKNNQN